MMSSPSLSQLKNMLVPYKQNVVLSVNFDSNRAKNVLDNFANISTHFSKDDKAHLAKSQLESIVKYGKKDGTKLTYNTDKKVSGGWGRVYCKNGCSYVTITRQLRYYLAYDKYSDHDIVNCHPVIARQLLGTFNINSKSLDDWNKNRDEYFDTMIEKSSHSISRDDCKKLGFCFLYGGDVARKFNSLGLNWNSDQSIQNIYETAQGVSRSMQVLQDAVSKAFPDVWKELPYNPVKDKPDWGKFSSFMQHLERHIVLIMFNLAQKSGYQVGDIAHDGLFLAQDGAPIINCKEYYSACIDEIQQETGLVIELSGKPMQCPEWTRELSYKKDDEILEYTDEYDAALYVIEKYDTILYHKDASVHVVHENVYKKSPISSSEVYLHKLINGIEYKDKENHDRTKAEKISKNIRDIVLGDTLKEINTVEEFNKNICLFPFINGVYDIRTNLLRSYRQDEVFLQKISKVYNKSLVDEQVCNKLKDVVFNVFEDGCQEYFFQLLSRALAGHYKDKSWAMFVGSRNSGKGTMVSCLELLKELIAHISPPIETLDTDCAKMYGSYMNAGCGIARLAITNEIKDNPYKPVKGSSEIIKNLNSGGDVISARLLNRNAVDFVCASSIFWFLNKVPEFTDTAVLNNCSLFNMPHVFDDDAAKTLASKAADVNIKSWITETPGVMESFLDILHKHYLSKPPKRIAQCNTSQYKQDNVTKFLNAYVFDADGWVLCSDVQALMPELNNMQLGKFITKHWGDKITRTQKNIKELVDGVPTSISKKGYQGISAKPTLDDMNC